ncbi:MAG TPA: DUF5808 domain-containing protein [Candidatus Acidoferrum sp.]|nr:DUF5808 domain-containing protein [Candidatus Acidoferrum sp.]
MLNSATFAAVFQGALERPLIPWFAALVAILLLLAVFFHYLPEITRPDIFFAVTVRPSFRDRPEAREIVRRFRGAVWVHTLIGLAAVFVSVGIRNPLIALAGIGWELAGITHALLRARGQTMPHAAVAAADHEFTGESGRSTGLIHALLQVGPFALLGAAALYLQTHWERIPARFPVHWGINGRPNGWSTRSIGGVYGPLLIGFAVCAVLEIISYGITHWTRQISTSGPAANSESRFRNAHTAILTAVQYFIAFSFASVPFLALRANPNESPAIGAFLLMAVGLVAITFAISIRTGQGGANLARSGEESDIVDHQPVGDRTPDECWRAGMFYVNPDDPAVLVEKRSGLGYTLNFGRPAAWVLMAFILALVILPLVIGFVSTHAR